MELDYSLPDSPGRDLKTYPGGVGDPGDPGTLDIDQPVYEECVPDPERPGVWTIPGYIAYSVTHAGDTLPMPAKGVDNPAFHDVDIPSVHFGVVPPTPVKAKAPPPPPRSRLTKGPLRRMWRLRVSKTGGGRRDGRATALLCVLLTALVLLLATVAVVLYLTVGGGLAQLSGKRQQETRQANREVVGSFRIVNRKYEPSMADTGSSEYQYLSNDIVLQVEALFRQSSVAEEYNSTEVVALRNGSVVVILIIHLTQEIPEAAKKVGMAFERGLINDYGQIRLGQMLIDFPSIRFQVRSSSPGAEPFEANENADSQSFDSNQQDTVHPSTTSESPVVPTMNVPSIVGVTLATYGPVDSTQTSISTTQTTFLPSPLPTDPPTAVHTRPSASSTAPVPPSPPMRPMTTPPWLVFPPGTRFPTPPPMTPPSAFSPDRPFPRRPFPGAGYSPRTAADLLVQWSPWSPWSSCDARACATNHTQIRTRECRTKNGTGPPLNDTRLCTLLGGVDTEIKDCPCSGTMSVGLKRGSESFTITSNTSPPPRLCNECLASEVCVALHVESFPTCRPPKDSKDVLACRGWCDPKVEYCQHLGNNSYRCVDDRLCLPEEWRCKDGLCVPKEKRCDGHFNCYDMTDEYDCECAPGHFHCGNNTSCIPNSKRCDGVIDCWDGQDESNCTKPCDSAFVPCNSGGCIPQFRLCDGYADCPDGSDEPEGCREEPCNTADFKCNNGRCLPSLAHCDGQDQCGDNSDEINCSTVSPSVALLQIDCFSDQFSCVSGACIPMISRCDGVAHCADLSDETECGGNSSFECPESTFLCVEGSSCISKSQLCDGIHDCPSGSDESNCTQNVTVTCLEASFTCANGRCVSVSDLCDSVNDCGDFSDELECNYHPHYQLEGTHYEINRTEEKVGIQIVQDRELDVLSATQSVVNISASRPTVDASTITNPFINKANYFIVTPKSLSAANHLANNITATSLLATTTSVRVSVIQEEVGSNNNSSNAVAAKQNNL